MEQRPALGGALNIASRPPFKEPLADLARHLEAQARSAGVNLETGRPFTAAALAERQPDEVIVATGASPWAPACLDPEAGGAVAAETLLACDTIPPGRYLVVGGGLVGLETAEYLAERGAEVTVVEMLDQVGAGLGPVRLKLLTDRLVKAGINLLTKTRVVALGERSLRVETGGREYSLGPCQAVVLATGYRCHPVSLPAPGAGIPVQVIGDASRARSLVEAMAEGLDAALNIGSRGARGGKKP
jgi:pyruvate/2-oxoglutarate dehydrogenase complex dihydrolipoamide dehydrogenase (E3) component